MNNHFDRGLRVKELIEQRKPSYVVEMGAGDGKNTRQLMGLMDTIGFSLITISTGNCPKDLRHDKFSWIDGISYVELPHIERGIDLCSIDTDHNYWTLKAELDALKPLMSDNSIIVMHDTESYAKSDGHMFGYDGHKTDYPDIRSHGKMGLQTAMCEFVNNSNFRIYRHTEEFCGATALVRGAIECV